MPLHRERIKGYQSLQPFPPEAIDRTLVWTPRYRWKIATRPETQITHTRGGRQSQAPVVFFLDLPDTIFQNLKNGMLYSLLKAQICNVRHFQVLVIYPEDL